MTRFRIGSSMTEELPFISVESELLSIYEPFSYDPLIPTRGAGSFSMNRVVYVTMWDESLAKIVRIY